MDRKEALERVLELARFWLDEHGSFPELFRAEHEAIEIVEKMKEAE